MAKLARLEIRDDFAPNTPSILAVVREVLACESEEPRPGVQNLTFEMPLSDQAVASCVERRVVRRVMSDASWQEYRISSVDKSVAGAGNRCVVSARDPIYDLGDAGLVSEVSSSGIVSYDPGIVQLTVTEIVDTWIIATLAAEYAHFQRGTIDPTAEYTLEIEAKTRLEILEALATAAADPITKLPAEVCIRQTSSAFYIDVLEQIGGTQPIADVRSRKNLIANVVRRPTDRMATVMTGFAADDGSGARSTIARSAWLLTFVSGTTYEIEDPDGGPSPVLEDDQLNGMYVVPNGNGPAVEITDSVAGAPATVVLASTTGITSGEVHELRANGAEQLLTELSSPSRIALYPPAKHGVITRDDLYGVRNRRVNPFFRTWSNSANPPDGGWAVNAGSSPHAVTSRNSDPLYTQYGGYSWRFQVANIAWQFQATSPVFYPRAVNGASTFAEKVRLFIRAFSGDARLVLRVESGTGALIATKEIIPTDYPTNSVSDRVSAGDYYDITINGIDLSAYNVTGVRLRLTVDNIAASGGAVGAVDVYWDASMVVQAPTAPPIWIEYSGANPLWHALNLALLNSREPIATYEVDVIDVTRLDGTAYPYDALVGGATIRLTDADGGVSGALLRIVARPRINWLVEGETQLTLATRAQLLADVLNRGASGSIAIGVSGPGPGSGGGGSTPPGPTPPGGGTPTPAPGTPPVVAGATLLKTILAPAGDPPIIEDIPAALTEHATDSRFHVDFTAVTDVFLAGAVVDDDGTAAEARLQYLRPSDATWRYLDGSAGPALPLDTAGDIIGASVNVEADARGLRLCRWVTINGDGADDPVLGHLSLHGGVTPSVPAPLIPIAGWLADWDPTEGSGTSVADKWGALDLSMTSPAPVWVASPPALRYSLNFPGTSQKYCYCISDALACVNASSGLFRVLLSTDVDGWLWGIKGNVSGVGHFGHHNMGIDATGKPFVRFRETSIVGALRTVTGTTVFGSGDECSLGWIHDGTTLKLFVNGVEEGSTACAPGVAYDTGTTEFIVGAYKANFSTDEAPQDCEIGRFLLWNTAIPDGDMLLIHNGALKLQYPGLP